MLIYARAQCLATRPLPGASRAPQSAPSRAKPPRSISALDSAPADFDPAEHPIIGQHPFDIAPLRSIGQVAAEVVGHVTVRAVFYWLARADEADGEGRRACLEMADAILRKADFRWGNIMPGAAA